MINQYLRYLSDLSYIYWRISREFRNQDASDRTQKAREHSILRIILLFSSFPLFPHSLVTPTDSFLRTEWEGRERTREMVQGDSIGYVHNSEAGIISQAYKGRVADTSWGLQSLKVAFIMNIIGQTPRHLHMPADVRRTDRGESRMFGMDAKYQGNTTESSSY